MAMDGLQCLILGKDKKVEVIDELEFKKQIKSKKILVKPQAISNFFLYAASNPDIEKAALLIGRLEGTFIVITETRNCTKGKSSAARVEIDHQEMHEIHKSLDKNSHIIGWAHSHISYGIFMSGTDIETQKDFQSMFSDAVALVLDPFNSNGMIEFGFFRIVNGKVDELEYAFLVNEHDAQ